MRLYAVLRSKIEICMTVLVVKRKVKGEEIQDHTIETSQQTFHSIQ